jgi:transcriptional regulator with XRE-family HTH domain
VVSKVKLERLKRGFTQDDICIRTGRRLHPSRLSRIERGTLQPTVDDIRLLADALDLPDGALSTAIMSNEEIVGAGRKKV